jgi:hypothetical protein
MIRNVKLVVFQNTLDSVEGPNLAQTYVSEDSMDNEKGCWTTFILAERFLMKLKLFSMNIWISPLKCTDSFHLLVFVVNDDYVCAKGFLNRLHPMSMNDKRCHFAFCWTVIDKTELEDLRSHSMFVCFGTCSSWGSGIRNGVLSSRFVLSGLEIAVKDGRKVQHGQGQYTRRATHVTRRDFNKRF